MVTQRAHVGDAYYNISDTESPAKKCEHTLNLVDYIFSLKNGKTKMSAFGPSGVVGVSENPGWSFEPLTDSGFA